MLGLKPFFISEGVVVALYVIIFTFQTCFLIEQIFLNLTFKSFQPLSHPLSPTANVCSVLSHTGQPLDKEQGSQTWLKDH